MLNYILSQEFKNSLTLKKKKATKEATPHSDPNRHRKSA